MRVKMLLFLCIAITAISFGKSPQSATTEKAVNTGSPLEKHGALIVLVTWGDVDNTPATDVIVEAVGHAPDHSWGKTVPLKASKNGQYEASLDPGIYDVFVSEPGSTPRCRRLAIEPKSTMYWTLKLEIDDVYHRGDRF
jgi:hypothetical protein